jgi:cyclin H
MTKGRPAVTDDDLYRHTSQFRLWSFTKDQLRARQQEVHDVAAKKVANQLKEHGLGEDDEIRPLTLDEELKLIRFYASKVENITKLFQMPSQVRATAVSYFRKFYLVYSVMDYHPKNILYTCVFLASKSENYFISIEKFCGSLPRTETTQLLNLEFLILQSLSFTLAVLNGLRPLHGFFLDLQATNPDIDTSTMGSIHDKARKTIVQGFISNAPFFYTPPQIALAALYAVDPQLTEKYIRKKYQDLPDHVDHLLEIVKDCKQELLDTSIPSSEHGKEIDRKLHSCLNPLKYIQKRKSSHTPDRSESPVPKKLKTQE